MKNIKINFVLITLIALSNFSFGQTSKMLIHDGNKLYEQKKFTQAETEYRKSLNTKENSFIGNYNLGNTLYQEGRVDEAKEQFQTAAADKSANAEQLSKTYHNLGNSYLKSKKYPESIESYKQALKLNPKDNDTRYNLAYAQSMLQQQQQQKNKDDKNKDNKDNKDKDKNQQKQDQKQDQKKQDQQKQDQDQKSEDQKQAEQKNAQQKDKISKEDADKILQALNNDEKKTQKKLNIKQPTKVTIEKQW